MKHIAILSCRKSIRVCTGASCLGAFNARTRGFAPYADEPVRLDAFFYCNGCDSDPETDPGMLEKLDRLQQIGVETVHTGLCTLSGEGVPPEGYCPRIARIVELLRARGIRVTHGTH